MPTAWISAAKRWPTSNNLRLQEMSVFLIEAGRDPGLTPDALMQGIKAAGGDLSWPERLIYRHLASPFGNSLPAGVTIDEKKSKTLLTAKENAGYITLTAAKDAKPVERQLVPVMAQASINFVMKMSYCGEPLRVTVTK